MSSAEIGERDSRSWEEIGWCYQIGKIITHVLGRRRTQGALI